MVTKAAQDYLKALTEELEISETRYEQAYNRYRSLGEWLDRYNSSIRNYDPAVYVQGSFALGTVVKPYTEVEEYDVDVVCELKLLSKRQLTQKQLKQLVGEEIKSYRSANNFQKPPEEKRRCWALNYADEAQFHMDIIPAIPNGAEVRLLLERSHLDASWADTAIGITDNEENNYTVITDDWPRSNPKGYLQWFMSRITALLESRKAELARSLCASVEEIPNYKVRTPLQLAIMILKRHRDIMFADDKTNRCPISIIITTLAGHSYQGEEHVAAALFAILSRMDRFIKRDGQRYIIANPSDPSENFADKWEEFPERKDAFFSWLKQARKDFEFISNEYDYRAIAEMFSSRIGLDLTKRAEGRSGRKSLLRGVSSVTASTVATPAFGDKPRRPTKPHGFA